MWTDFQSPLTAKLSRKFTIRQSLKIPPLPECLATLPCEIFQKLAEEMKMSENVNMTHSLFFVCISATDVVLTTTQSATTQSGSSTNTAPSPSPTATISSISPRTSKVFCCCLLFSADGGRSVSALFVSQVYHFNPVCNAYMFTAAVDIVAVKKVSTI